MINKIQTQTSGGDWVDCDHQSWKELKEDGWVFESLTSEGHVVMTRKGYINVFRGNPAYKEMVCCGVEMERDKELDEHYCINCGNVKHLTKVKGEFHWQVGH